MLYAGLDLSSQRLDVHVLDEDGGTVEVMAVRPDAAALRTPATHWLRHGHEPGGGAERERAPFRLHLVRHRTALKNRIHATLISFGHPVPVADLFGVAGRELLARMEGPEPWRSARATSLALG